MRVLVLCPHYLPGFRSGGPVRSVCSMIERLGDEIEFHVISHARDYRQKALYPNVPIGKWTQVGRAQVLYLRDRSLTPFSLGRHVRDAKPDAVYLNSFFHPQMTLGALLLRRLGLLPKVPFIIAPRGEFSSGALAIHPTKKWLFMAFARLIGLYDNLLWQASSDFEKQDILRGLKRDVRTVVMHVAPDMSSVHEALKDAGAREPKTPGILRLVFVGRVSKMKNLHYALDRLRNLRGAVTFDIFGPMEDRSYADLCKQAARALPDNVKVAFHGEIPHDEAVLAFARHHLFLLPTLGENFGHVILESLVAGCPVIISDKTPWRNLAGQGVGWDISLDDPQGFEDVLQQAIDMDGTSWEQLSTSAMSYAARATDDTHVLDATRRMFLQAQQILSGSRDQVSQTRTQRPNG